MKPIKSPFLILVGYIACLKVLYRSAGDAASISSGGIRPIRPPPGYRFSGRSKSVPKPSPDLASPPPCTAELEDSSTKPKGNLQGRNGRIDTKYRWKTMNIKLDSNYTPKEKEVIIHAVSILADILHGCVNFGIYVTDQIPDGDYVNVVREGGCKSWVGKMGTGAQKLWLGPNCIKTGTVLHEFIHALGLWHEQARPDRDDHVIVHYDNIAEKNKPQFKKLPWNEVSDFWVAYNTNSIMHYASTYFAVNKNLPTITKKDGSRIPPTGGFTEVPASDELKLKRMYNCEKRTPGQNLQIH